MDTIRINPALRTPMTTETSRARLCLELKESQKELPVATFPKARYGWFSASQAAVAGGCLYGRLDASSAAEDPIAITEVTRCALVPTTAHDPDLAFHVYWV